LIAKRGYRKYNATMPTTRRQILSSAAAIAAAPIVKGMPLLYQPAEIKAVGHFERQWKSV